MEKVDGPKPTYIKKAIGNMAFQQIIFAGRAKESCRISFLSNDLRHRQVRNLDGIRACQIVHIISGCAVASTRHHPLIPSLHAASKEGE